MFCEEPRPELAIYMKNLSKQYPIYNRSGGKLLELLFLQRKKFHRDFWALHDLDLEVERGTVLGIVGQNGSGKSTLLQIVTGILRQTRGDCFVNGTISALLELGAGFNLEFTGRENIFMHGAIIGLTRRQMEERLEDVLSFAEIGEFVDQPVKIYSSGMFMRLAFSVAIHVDPDILLVDEALSVGDLIFQHRCISRIRRLREAGKTILFVSHDLQAVTSFCDRAILLDCGKKLEDGTPEEVVQRYQALISERERKAAGSSEHWVAIEQDGTLESVTTIPHIHHRFGHGGAEILGIILHSREGKVLNQVRSGEEVRLIVSARLNRDIGHPIIGFTVRDRLGVEITSSNTSYAGLHLPAGKAGDVFTIGFRLSIPALRPGSYSISPAVAEGNIWEHTIEDWIDNAFIVDVVGTGLIYGLMHWPVKVSFNMS